MQVECRVQFSGLSTDDATQDGIGVHLYQYGDYE